MNLDLIDIENMIANAPNPVPEPAKLANQANIQAPEVPQISQTFKEPSFLLGSAAEKTSIPKEPNSVKIAKIPELDVNRNEEYLQIMPDFENILIKTILERPGFFNKAKTILNRDSFKNILCWELYNIINNFYDTYKKIPLVPEIQLELRNIPNSEIRAKLQSQIAALSSTKLVSRDFMDDYTTRYVKDKMFEKALIVGADFVDKKDENSKIKAKDLIDKSQKIQMTQDLGDTFSDYKERLEYYQNPEKGLLYKTFNSFNQRLGEGILPGTLNVFLAPPGIGKSMLMSFSIGEFLKQNKNVLLVSMEMSNFEFLKRVDADLLDIPIWDLKNPSRRDEIIQKLEGLKDSLGELYVQNYAPGNFSAYSLEALLDLYNSNNIKIDVVMLDYLGLMKSDRIPASAGLYSYVKAIGEEVRAVAKHSNIPIFTANQLNRSTFGKDSKEVDNSSISDSMGTAMTADLLVMILQNETQKTKGEVTFKITKNRYTGKTDTFNVAVNYSKMRFEDVLEPGPSFITAPQQIVSPPEDPFGKLGDSVLGIPK